jgi:S-formylglutathione hydrolase
MKEIESIKESGGYLNRYTHASSSCNCEMTFSVYLPPQASNEKVPALYWLSGLTCTDDNARTKGGFQRFAARHGIAIVFADTSPRGDDVADEPERYDLGQAAGFYVNATRDRWQPHYHMFDYVTCELPALVEANLPLLPGNCGWGQGCFGAYLGDDTATWEPYDATCLVKDGARVGDILIDQGEADEFLHEGQLLPDNFQAACAGADQPCTIRMQPGYDHSYHFIASFIEDHFDYHAKFLK